MSKQQLMELFLGMLGPVLTFFCCPFTALAEGIFKAQGFTVISDKLEVSG